MRTFNFFEVTTPVTNDLPLPNQNQDTASNVTDPEARGLGKLEVNEAPESDTGKESNLSPESISTTAANDGCNNLAKNNSSLKGKIWKDLVNKFKDLNDNYFKNKIDGGKCGKKFKGLTKTYKLRADQILINNPSVYPWNFGQSRTSRSTSMTTILSNGRIVQENIFGDGRREIKVLSEVVVSNDTNTSTNTNDNHASDLHSVISDNKDEESLTTT
ncbi:hypothetical protein F4703DRAFT_1934973 [Phycomyces blakesleeanus]